MGIGGRQGEVKEVKQQPCSTKDEHIQDDRNEWYRARCHTSYGWAIECMANRIRERWKCRQKGAVQFAAWIKILESTITDELKCSDLRSILTILNKLDAGRFHFCYQNLKFLILIAAVISYSHLIGTELLEWWSDKKKFIQENMKRFLPGKRAKLCWILCGLRTRKI